MDEFEIADLADEAARAPTQEIERPWNTEAPFCVRVFCAALQGIIANPGFHGKRIDDAIDFADKVVLKAVYGKDA
jgi:hypothetical protein